MLDPPIGMEGEASFAAVMDRVAAGPRPAAEPGGVVVIERLTQFFGRVHHEGAHLEDRGSDRLALQQEKRRRAAVIL